MKDLIIAILAALGVLAQIGVVLLIVGVIAARVSPAARTSLAPARQFIVQWGLWIGFGVALVATLGSLWFSEYADFLPCRLCWFQRIAMYPLVPVLLAGAILKDRRAFWYAIPLPVIGAAISAYHVYVEQNPEADSCAAVGSVPCSTKWIDEFGYITIPVLAGSAFVLIALLLSIGFRRREPV